MATKLNEFTFRPSDESRRGAALLVAMIALMLIMVIGGAFLRLGMSTKNESGSAMDQDEAFYICEAAIAESGAALTAGKSGSIAGPALPARYGNGLFWVVATDLGNNDHQVDATAMCGGGRSALRAVIHVTPNPNVSAGILGDQGVTIASNVLVDSFNSANGSYASQPKKIVHGTSVVNTLGNVRSNSSLGVSSNDNFFGNVTPGPGNSVTGMQNNTYVFGSTAAATTPVPLPPVVVPAIASQGAKSVSKNDPVAQRTLAPGSYHYTSLTIGNQTAFTIQGPATVVLDGFTSNPGCSLLVDGTNGPVSIYFTNTATFVSNMTITSNSPTAKNISLLFSSSNPVSLASNASLLGTIYAPNAAVSVSSNWVVYGAITGKTINLASNVQFHYDEALNNAPGNNLPTVSISSWFERPMPVGTYARKRTDPFALMGIHQIDCPYPANAWN
jgi:Tfp pilus assembly protein PilX